MEMYSSDLNVSRAGNSMSTPVQVVFPGQTVGWAAAEQSVRDFDEQQIKDYKEDIDTILVFVCRPCSFFGHGG